MIFTVAIDGPAAAGKGTIARAVAEHFGFAYLDTGLLYRAAARKAMDGMDPEVAAKALTPQDFGRDGLRTAKVGQAASKIAAMPAVRAALVTFQHDFARRDGGAVLDGRDIGTVICPEADVKLYVTASNAVRAHRRWLELGQKPGGPSEAEILADLEERDRRDRERAVAPLKAAADAVVLDTSEMGVEEAVEMACRAVSAVLDTDDYSSKGAYVDAWNNRGRSGQFFRKRGLQEKVDVEVDVALEWARAVEAAFGLVITDIKSTNTTAEHIPDCSGVQSGQKVTIEATELVDERALKIWAEIGNKKGAIGKATKAGKRAELVKELKDLEAEYRSKDIQWTEEQFRAGVAACISKKASSAAMEGTDYLVIHTDETWLSSEMVRRWLANGTFPREERIRNAYLLMTYEPGGSDHWPVFDLYLGR